jgi:hypothetical protein
MATETDQAQWLTNLTTGLTVAQSALGALQGLDSADPIVIYEEPSFLDEYGAWLAAGAGVLILALLLKQ